MAKLTGVSLSQVKGNGNAGELKAKIARNTVAIVGEKGVVLCTNNSDICNMYQQDSVVDACLEALVDLLESVPDNTDELVAKPFRVILPKVISGIATGSFIDYIRTGKSVTSGEDMPKERLEAYAHIMKLMSSKYANVELVADRHMGKADREVVDPAWKTLKAEIANAVRGNGIMASAKASKPEMSDEDKARLAELKAKLAKAEDELLDAEDEETEAKLEKKIAKLQSMLSRTIANAGGQGEAEEKAEQPKVASDIADLI